MFYPCLLSNLSLIIVFLRIAKVVKRTVSITLVSVADHPMLKEYAITAKFSGVLISKANNVSAIASLKASANLLLFLVIILIFFYGNVHPPPYALNIIVPRFVIAILVNH